MSVNKDWLETIEKVNGETQGGQLDTAAWEETVHQAFTVSDASEERWLTPGGRKRATPGSRV